MINQLQEKYQLSLLLLLSIVAVLGVFPFVITRYLAGNFLAAIIDMILVLGIIVLVAYAYSSKKIRLVSAVIAIFINIGVVTIVIANGMNSFLWVYPVFASTFVLIKPTEALLLNIVAAVSIATMSDILDSISLDSYVVTLLMLSMCVFIYASHGAKQFRLLKTLNSVDELTGALNRRAMRTDMQAALSDAENNGTKQLLAILDMDYFKKVNDSYGHAVGDQVLKDFVSITSSHIGKNDRLYRFGGEEFVLLIPHYTDQYTYITALRAAIKSELKTPDGKAITVSYGVAKWLPGTTIDTWLKRADVALYLAKEKGRDCAVYNDD